MASRRRSAEPEKPSRPPGTTREAREHQIVSAAYDLAEQQIQAGTASSQVISHFLKLGSSREMLEQERLIKENHLLQIKADAIASAQRVEALYADALSVMRAYQGQPPEEIEEYYDD